jgi:hypothetical protein
MSDRTNVGSDPQGSDTGGFDPRAEIDAFDWNELEQRFQQEMQQCGEKEQALLEEFQRMMGVCRPTSTGPY